MAKASPLKGGFMSAQSSKTIQASLPFPLRVLVRRMLAMAALWTLFGIVVGSALMPGDAIGLLAGAIAGALVLSGMGLLLGLLGGRVAESFVGGLAGALVALISGVLAGGKIDVFTLDLCLIIGGVMGANAALFLTARAWLRQQGRNRQSWLIPAAPVPAAMTDPARTRIETSRSRPIKA
jgi:hypothetical protein